MTKVTISVDHVLEYEDSEASANYGGTFTPAANTWVYNNTNYTNELDLHVPYYWDATPGQGTISVDVTYGYDIKDDTAEYPVTVVAPTVNSIGISGPSGPNPMRDYSYQFNEWNPNTKQAVSWKDQPGGIAATGDQIGIASEGRVYWNADVDVPPTSSGGKLGWVNFSIVDSEMDFTDGTRAVFQSLDSQGMPTPALDISDGKPDIWYSEGVDVPGGLHITLPLNPMDPSGDSDSPNMRYPVDPLGAGFPWKFATNDDFATELVWWPNGGIPVAIGKMTWRTTGTVTNPTAQMTGNSSDAFKFNNWQGADSVSLQLLGSYKTNELLPDWTQTTGQIIAAATGPSLAASSEATNATVAAGPVYDLFYAGGNPGGRSDSGSPLVAVSLSTGLDRDRGGEPHAGSQSRATDSVRDRPPKRIAVRSNVAVFYRYDDLKGTHPAASRDRLFTDA